MRARRLILPLAFFSLLGIALGSLHARGPGKNGYIGVVSSSDERKRGDQFVFANLKSNQPLVTFPTGNAGPTEKVFEDDETIVLIYVASVSGSTETFYLSKKRERFTLIEVGALEATVTRVDFRPKVTYGNLKGISQ